ncbi:hypothetical protein OPV22_016124 [Ensete ventricosum]|uniref:B box-type domain-containing protein n=1 Tax=Ensete ventricosum TaxID=4639 RepID=A0AAV8QKD9_ENSVE|nr:hypothetical protein OPV22_016124 [Ensete ventricosum]
MKIQCNACEAAEAAVLCCADEAALCWACDEKVHAANRLAGKHQRVPLLSNDGGGAVAGRSSSTASGVPKCDICQEASGYFFCLEDRALLCRKCDLSIHTANSYVSAHQRFLLTGVRVGLESAESVPVANQQLHAAGKAVLSPSKQLPSSRRPMSSTETNAVPSSQIARVGGSVASISMSGIVPDWPFDEFFGFPDINQNGFEEHNASKADSGKLGSHGSSPLYCSVDGDLDAYECLGQHPEHYWAVPEIASPPTASGLGRQRNLLHPVSDDAAFVPDLCSSSHYATSSFRSQCHHRQ